jgi:hypothetical protein
VRSGVPTVPPGYGARVPGWEDDKGGEIPRSRDHGATVPSTPVRFLLLPQHRCPGGLGNNKLRLRDGGWRETGGNATSEKGTRPLMMRTGHRLRAIEEQCTYMIREMATSI